MSATLVAVGTAATAGLFTYWALVPRLARSPADETPKLHAARREAVMPMLAALEKDAALAGIPFNPALFLTLCVAFAAAGYLTGSLLKNNFLALLGLGMFFFPIAGLRKTAGYRSQQIDTAVGKVLLQFAKIAAVRHHPFLVVQDSLPALPPVLRTEFERALRDYESNTPFEDALTAVAMRCGENFYLIQLAELARATIHTGADLAKGCEKLLSRYDLVHELRSEQRANTAPFVWACWLIFIGSLVPIPYWAITNPANLRYFTEVRFANLGLAWTVVFGLFAVSLPYLFGLEE